MHLGGGAPVGDTKATGDGLDVLLEAARLVESPGPQRDGVGEGKPDYLDVESVLELIAPPAG
jgi:hypothetical protein